MKQRITSHVLYFQQWSGGELRPLTLDKARRPLALWQVTREKRSIWIAFAALEFYDAMQYRPDGYQLRRKGAIIETAEIDWSDPSRPRARNLQQFKYQPQ